MSDKKGNRIITKIVTDDGGGTEFYWHRGEDDWELNYSGSLLLHEDGSATFKCWTEAEIPVVVHIIGNRVVIAHSEDQPPAPDDYVFDTDALTVKAEA